MKNTFLLIIVTLLLSVSLQADDGIKKTSKSFRAKTAIIVFFDVAGLNNYYSSRELYEKNIAQYTKLISKQTLRKQRVSSIAYYTLDEQIRLVGKIESNKIGKILRESQTIMKNMSLELKQDQSNKAKDIINTFHFINTVVEQSYADYKKVKVIMFSNLRDSISTKKQRKNMQPIEINDKITLDLYAASGINAIKGSTTLQTMKAEASISAFYKNLLSAKHLSISTVY